MHYKLLKIARKNSNYKGRIALNIIVQKLRKINLKKKVALLCINNKEIFFSNIS